MMRMTMKEVNKQNIVLFLVGIDICKLTNLSLD